MGNKNISSKIKGVDILWSGAKFIFNAKKR
jgi:hypothetical protein